MECEPRASCRVHHDAQRCASSIYRLASWARSTIVPLLIVSHHRPIFALPNGESDTNDFLDELWEHPAQKNVPYWPPFGNL